MTSRMNGLAKIKWNLHTIHCFFTSTNYLCNKRLISRKNFHVCKKFPHAIFRSVSRNLLSELFQPSVIFSTSIFFFHPVLLGGAEISRNSVKIGAQRLHVVLDSALTLDFWSVTAIGCHLTKKILFLENLECGHFCVETN